MTGPLVGSGAADAQASNATGIRLLRWARLIEDQSNHE
jgi:hypothetical protein